MLLLFALVAVALPAQPRYRPAPLPTPTPTPAPAAPVDPVVAFDEMLGDVLASRPEEQSARLAAWVRDFDTPSPLERPDGSTVFFFLGEALEVGLLGDMVQWATPLPLRRIGATRLWLREVHFEPNARFDYVLSVDGALLPDPRNARPAWTPFGPGSEWVGRGYATPPYRAAALPAGAQGTLRRFRLGAATLHVHLPPGYDENPTRRYPVVYCPVEGERYGQEAELPRQLDERRARLGGDRGAIAVMVEHAAEPARLAADPATARWVIEELVPFADRALRTRPTREARVLLGAGWGAAVCLDAAIEAPQLFGGVLLQSPSLLPEGRDLIERLRHRTPMGLRMVVEVGKYETAFDGHDLLAEGRRVRSILGARPIDYRYREFPQGSSWGFWRDRLAVLLPEVLGD